MDATIEYNDAAQLRLADPLAEELASDAKASDDGTTLSAIFSELRVLCKLTLPIIVSSILESCMSIITMTAAGHLGVTDLGGVGLGRVLGNCTGMAPLMGLIRAMDTLATQAHGASRLTLVGTLAQRASLMALLACLPIFIFWWNMGPILLMLGQDPLVVPKAIEFLKWRIPGVYPLLIFKIIEKYLQAQHIVYPIPFILALTLAFHAAATYVLIWPFQLGFIGCSLAMSLSYTFMMLLGLLYIRFSATCLPCCTPVDPMQCWGGWSRDAFRQWPTFLRIGIPSAALLCLEWWSFELVMLMAGMLGMTQLATANMIMQLIVFTFMPPMAISAAAAMRLGQRLGAGDASGAQLTARTVIAFVTAEVTLNGLSVFGVLDIWTRMFTTDIAVLELMNKLRLLIVALVFFDGMQGGMVGILHGSGLQAWGVSINFISQWLVGIPLAAIAAFHLRWGLFGLFTGQLCGTLLVPTLYIIVISCLNWSKVAKTARQRAGCHLEVQMEEIAIECETKASEEASDQCDDATIW